MAIVKMAASKATPVKAVAYVMEPGKMIRYAVRNMDGGSDMARQMMLTAKMWGKAQGPNDRKYYHLKISFAPQDRQANGGKLTPDLGLKIVGEILDEFFPTHETLRAAHEDKKHLHIHTLINAVDLETGKMVDMRQHQYCELKDRVQQICEREGLQAIDWRDATQKKRQKELQPDLPVSETFAEAGLKERGEQTWKDELRQIIDAAAGSCTSMDEFKESLKSQNVILTRCTEQTISYKLGDHRACRGDTLGGDYTAEAIRNALDVNANQRTQGDAERVIDSAERALYRDLGRAAGVKRAEVDDMCEQAVKATWEEKQATWDEYRAAKEEFWNEYNARQAALRKELNAEYKLKKKLRAAQWAVDPRNRRKSLLGVVYALIVLSRNKPSDKVERHIEHLKEEQKFLRMTVDRFKRTTGESLEKLKERDLPLEEYMAAVKQLQSIADDLHEDFSVIQRKDLQRERDKIQKASRKASLDDKISGAVQNVAPVKSSGKARKTPGRDR